VTALVWDQPGQHVYETGVERGVLYFPVLNVAAVWNGLVSVTETTSRTVNSYYQDGVKYLDHLVPDGYSGKLQAFTYPDILDALLGNREIAPGVQVHDQYAVMFNLSYRTRIASEINDDLGYKLHLLYNVTATESDVTFNTIADPPTAITFEWDLTATPDSSLTGKRPTAHASIDSRKVDATKLATLETQLYGSDTTNPSMPSLAELSDIFT
jgi:hypothetical protein